MCSSDLGEGLGPRKELFALLGAAATRTWTPVSGNALRIETCEGARSLRVACDEADPQHVKAGDCLAVDFEGDTLELVVEKVADHTLRVSTNAPAVRVLAKRFGDDEDAETKLLEALAGCVAEVRRGAAGGAAAGASWRFRAARASRPALRAAA